MKYLKNEKRKRTPWIIILVLVIVLAVVAAMLILPKDTQNEIAEIPETLETTAVPTESTASTIPQETVEAPPIEIDTPYGALYYPGEWAEGLRTEIVEEDFNTAVAFYGPAGGEEYLLFTLHFGGAAGFPVGVVQWENGLMFDVTAEMNDFAVSDSWSIEETNNICAMQDALNYVIEKLIEIPGFAPVA